MKKYLIFVLSLQCMLSVHASDHNNLTHVSSFKLTKIQNILSFCKEHGQQFHQDHPWVMHTAAITGLTLCVVYYYKITRPEYILSNQFDRLIDTVKKDFKTNTPFYSKYRDYHYNQASLTTSSPYLLWLSFDKKESGQETVQLTCMKKGRTVTHTYNPEKDSKLCHKIDKLIKNKKLLVHEIIDAFKPGSNTKQSIGLLDHKKDDSSFKG